ncbi:MAG TPA: ABC transporter substrate-binding protein [Actinoallomurus sp.]|jgi:ABC-type oligopeptide transport system substrate-binding subunit/serine/threonine protein kinase
MPEAAPLRTNDPEQLGSYRLSGRLGEGGQGVVYLGEDPDGGQVAVKLLHAQFSGDAKARARFASELANAKRVAPFCTAQILDADVEGDTPYLVSELIDGPSLREVVDAQGPRTGGVLHRLAIGTATALAAIHEAGVVHRDLKPTNVLLAADGPRVIDFGIARALDAGGTVTSTTVGTPSYMSPEQINGEVAGPPTDVFAWACMIVYAATGTPPFGQDTIPAVMNRIMHQEPALGMLMGPLRDVVAACLAKDPRHRPTAQQLLLRLLSNEGVSLPGMRPAPSTEVLNQGAQVAGQNTDPSRWSPPGSPYPPGDSYPRGAYPTGQDTPPPGGVYGPGPDTPPPGRYPPGGDAPSLYGRRPPRRRARPGVMAGAAAALVLLVSAGTFAGVKLAGHGGGGTSKPTPAPVGRVGGTFRMAMSAPQYVEPSNAITTADFFIVENLFIGLSQIRPDGSIAPALATQATADPTCKQWRFTIRQGTTFSNGEPVDAAAFARSWNRTVANRTGGEGYLMNDIQGYDGVVKGDTKTMSGLTTSGPGVLQVTLTQPDCDFSNRVAAPVFAPMPPAAGDASNASYNRLPIGNGPFKVGTYTQGARLTLVRNDSYAFAKPKLDQVDATFITDLSAALSGFDAGQYDWAELQSASIPTAIARHSGDGELIKGAIGGMTFLLPIDDKGMMKSKDARQAVSYALDRQALVSSAYQGIYPPANSMVPPGIPGALANGCAACVHDATTAKTLAQQAGLGPGAAVTLTVGKSSSYTQLAAVVREQLESTLGWKVQIRELEITKFYQDEASGGAQGLYPFSWVGDYPSPENFLDALLASESIQRRDDGSVGGSNYARYSSPAFDNAMKAARSTVDPAQRTKQLQAAEKLALDDMALIPLYSHTQYRVADTKSFVGIGMDYIGYPVLATAAHK